MDATLVLNPAHAGGDGTCTRTAFDSTTGRYVPCPHPSHNPDAPPIERLTAENEELRAALGRWQAVAAIYQDMARGTTGH